MSYICVKLAHQSANLCTPTGPGACNFTADNQVLLHDPSCSSGSFMIYSESHISPQRVQDMTELFYLALISIVVIWGMKQLINLFNSDSNRD